MTNSHQTKQRCKRYKFHCEGHAIANNTSVAFTVEDVSFLGLKVVLQEPIEMNRNYALKIFAHWKKIEIIARPIWDNDENRMGFEVLNKDPQWIEFMKLVESGYFEAMLAQAG